MTNSEIAAEMVKITDGFQIRTGIPDEIIDGVIRLCFRKMEITNQPAEYILLLLPDELEHCCIRLAITAAGIENMRRKGDTEYVRDMQTDTMPPKMSECT